MWTLWMSSAECGGGGPCGYKEVHVDYVDHVERLRCWTRGRFYDTINIDKSVVDN
jgi:hypothetical protein